MSAGLVLASAITFVIHDASTASARASSAPRSAAGGGEANLPGTPWRIPAGRSGGISGYASATSISPGQALSLYVSTPARKFRVRAYRMGWYRGVLARQISVSGWARGGSQSRPYLVHPRLHTWMARWHRSVTLSTRRWIPGDYLLRLESSRGRMGFIPLAVRSRSTSGRVVMINAVTTWQAYNLWGCCDLYQGRDGSFGSRSRAVSFDRPYANEDGAGQFIRDELGVVAEAERIGLKLSYVTDIDLALRPRVLSGARAAVSMGHDEYYSPTMRHTLTVARSHGTNLAFLGANSVFRRIRFGNTAIARSRLEINYKVASEDPLYGRNNPAVTADWPAPPAANPESSLLGGQYGCYFGRRPNVAGVITRPTSWVYRGVRVHAGERLPGLIGPEIDSIQRRYPTPRGIISVMHSPAPCPGGAPRAADASFYVAPSGAGVFDAGSINWACEVGPRCGGTITEPTHRVVRQVTDNVLLVFSRGPVRRR